MRILSFAIEILKLLLNYVNVPFLSARITYDGFGLVIDIYYALMLTLINFNVSLIEK